VVIPGSVLVVGTAIAFELEVLATIIRPLAEGTSTIPARLPNSLTSLSELVSIRFIDPEHSSASTRLRFTEGRVTRAEVLDPVSSRVSGLWTAGRFSPRDSEAELDPDPSGLAIGRSSNIECS
jgi:hypothetical protein